MEHPYITPSQNTTSGGSQNKQTNSGPSGDINNLFASLRYLQNQLEDIRHENKALEEEINPDGNRKTFLGDARDARESYYENRISDIEVTLSKYGVNRNSSSSSLSASSIGAGSSVDGEVSESVSGTSDSFFDKGMNALNSAYDFGVNAFNSFVGGVSNGFNALLNMVGEAKNWFVSQIRGWSNPNEDSKINNGNCAFASAVMLGRIFGKLNTNPKRADSQIEYLRGLVSETDENEGTTLNTAAKALKKIGLTTNVGQGNIEGLRRGLAGGNKYLLAVNAERYEEFTGKDLAYSPHAVVLMAIEGDKALLYDPGQQKPLVVSVNSLRMAMKDMDNQVMAVSGSGVA